jgi:pimeloyl-ACP methyl ester carboxylesterase
MEISPHGIGSTSVGAGFPVVLLHGFSTAHRSMVRAFEPAFVEDPGWLRIYVDLPGMGASRPLRPRTTDEVMDHLGPAGRDLPEPVVFERDEELLDSLPDDVREAFAAAPVVRDRAAFSFFEETILPAIRVSDGDEWIADLWEHGYVPRRHAVVPHEPFLGPSLLIVGRQDAIVGYRDQLGLVDTLPRATVAVLDYCGHSPEVEREQLFRALVRDWLDRLRRGGCGAPARR